MVGQVKIALQKFANYFGYQVRRMDAEVDLVDPYKEQLRILGAGIKTVFEVGACDGRDCVTYANMFEQATVYAFEPVPQSFRHLQQRAAEHPRLVPCNVALS